MSLSRCDIAKHFGSDSFVLGPFDKLQVKQISVSGYVIWTRKSAAGNAISAFRHKAPSLSGPHLRRRAVKSPRFLLAPHTRFIHPLFLRERAGGTKQTCRRNTWRLQLPSFDRDPDRNERTDGADCILDCVALRLVSSYLGNVYRHTNCMLIQRENGVLYVTKSVPIS